MSQPLFTAEAFCASISPRTGENPPPRGWLFEEIRDTLFPIFYRVDARGGQRSSRGGEGQRVSLEHSLVVYGGRGADLVALDDALQSLAALDPRRSRVVELRFFGGLSVEETAEILHVSPETVMHDWKLAKAWLRRAMGK